MARTYGYWYTAVLKRDERLRSALTALPSRTCVDYSNGTGFGLVAA